MTTTSTSPTPQDLAAGKTQAAHRRAHGARGAVDDHAGDAHRGRDWDPEAMAPFGPKPVPEHRWFESKSLPQRLLIMFAGVAMTEGNGVQVLADGDRRVRAKQLLVKGDHSRGKSADAGLALRQGEGQRGAEGAALLGPAQPPAEGTAGGAPPRNDDAERINYPKMEKIGRMVHQASWDLANATARPTLGPLLVSTIV